jgi:GTP-binding protein LepA
MLDTLSVERERGITVKASAASSVYKGQLLNFVDTPGHVDFSHEVTRSLSCVQGALILFDAAQGVQAQSFKVYEQAKQLNLPLIPVLTKIDLPSARVEEIALSISECFPDFDPDEIILTSARDRKGMTEILDAVVEKIPPPSPPSYEDNAKVRATVVDSWYEPLRGVVCLLQMITGTLTEASRVTVLSKGVRTSSDSYSIQEVGFVLPERWRTKKLGPGQMGYAIVGMRDPRQAKAGGLLVLDKEANAIAEEEKLIIGNSPVEEASNSIRSVLYASVHPSEEGGFDALQTAVDKLALNDTGLDVEMQRGGTSADTASAGGPWLGPGLKIGFMGLLHMEIFRQRLKDEFYVDALVTSPKVSYLIVYQESSRRIGTPPDKVVEDLSEWPTVGEKFEVHEPMVKMRILAPVDYAGAVMELVSRRRGQDMSTQIIDERTWLFTSRMPWAEVVTDFHDQLKNATAGYASADTTTDGTQVAKLAKVELALNGDVVDVLSFVAHVDVAASQGRSVCEKLKEVLPRQQFAIAVQAKIGNTIIARETVKPYRKDVLNKSGKMVGGGDISRKKKLLEKQKEGKKRMSGGKVALSQAAFTAVISR